MRKLLIVEDEATSRDGLKALFSNFVPTVKIETADDGLDGCQKALTFHPDIIICDIQMPNCNGLDMIEKLVHKNITAKVILLTGFAEFSYAQRALQYGVSDYILKPIVPDQITSKVQSLLIDIEKEEATHMASNTSKLYLLSEDDQPSFHRTISACHYTDFFYAVIYLGDATHLPDNIKNAFQQSDNIYTVTLADRHYRGIIMGFKNNTVKHLSISKLTYLLAKFDTLSCIYNIKKERQIKSWMEEFNTLKDAVCWSITYDSAFFSYESEMMETETFTAQDNELYKKELQKLYYSNDYSICNSFILDHLKAIQSQQVHPRQILLTATSSIIKINSEQQYLSTINKLSNAKTMPEITRYITEYFDAADNHISNNHYSKLVSETIKLIHLSYKEPLTLSSAASRLSITPQYLSKLFTQETTQTFIDYLTSVRMEKAKSLLTTTDKQVHIIGGEVGYPDARYFCTLFKKQVGLTPNQFRKTAK
ncbi:MAG: response regulator [Hespellia sp.]|nr:response regulator [Hespellia sp.]